MAPALQLSDLTQAWVHAHEEDTATEVVYRPANYPFPPSRGRNGFELRPDGTLIRTGPGATDRTVQSSGTWKLAGDKLELISTSRAPAQTLKINGLAPDRLLIAK